MLGKIDEKYKKDSIQIAGFILNNATKEYSTVITSLESSGKGKDVNAIQEAFEKHWEKNYKGKGKKEEAFNIEYKFKGKCNYCGITGHKEAECRKKKREAKENSGNNDGRGYSGKKKMQCWICGGDHTKKECPKYKEKKSNEVNSIFSELFMCNHVNKPKPASYKEALMHEIYCSEIEQEGIDTVIGTADAVEELHEETNVEEEEVPSIGFCSFCMESGQYMNECECGGIFSLEPNVDALYSEGEEDESIKEVESDDEDDNPPPLKERNPSGSTAGYNSDDEEEDEVILIEMRRGDIQESQVPKLYTHGVPMWGWCNICGRAGYYALACSCEGHYTEEVNPRIYDSNQSDDQDNILEFMYRITKKKMQMKKSIMYKQTIQLIQQKNSWAIQEQLLIL
jgi:hypothetical protein